MAILKKVVVTETEDVSDTSEIENSPSESEFSNEDESADNNESAEVSQKGNLAWADSIAKILKTNKPKKKRTLVLSKAKKVTDIKKPNSQYVGFEIEGEDGKIKKENLDLLQASNDKLHHKLDKPVRKRKRELPNLRVKPNILEREHERKLTKIATKGVVQLFNAVRTQQKDLSNKLKEAGPLEVRKEKVLKNIDKKAFLDTLMGEKSQKCDDRVMTSTDSTVTSEEHHDKKKSTTWNVLRDDFMMGAKMKDWDKELEEEIEME